MTLSREQWVEKVEEVAALAINSGGASVTWETANDRLKNDARRVARAVVADPMFLGSCPPEPAPEWRWGESPLGVRAIAQSEYVQGPQSYVSVGVEHASFSLSTDHARDMAAALVRAADYVDAQRAELPSWPEGDGV